ncbi:MAG: hypothetical protein IJB09_09800 [Oscillospiraceae bacterium]|nr:hypothetical protein [Oscillospiraceae bacterium]
MKDYGVERKKFIENTLYRVAQLEYFFLQYCARSRRMREHYKGTYKDYFITKLPCIRENYSIPNGKHCNPVCLITSDLILRENLPLLKRGLVKLLKKHHSHKFLGGFRSIDEVLTSVENMDDTLTWHYTSIDAGRFDFDLLPSLQPYISYFDLHIRKINDSYLSVETHIYFTKQYANNLQQIIDSNITEQKTYINFAFRRNNKQSGGRKTFALCHYNEANQKSDVIHENMVSLKWKFYCALQRFFPTVLHELNLAPPGILFYQTNIDYSDSSATQFWRSLGVPALEWQAIDESKKIFFKTDLSARFSKHTHSDMIFIFHDEKTSLEAGFHDLAFQIIHWFYWDYSRDFFKFQFLDILNNYFSKELIHYKHKLNRIKLRKRRIHSLLKLHYKFERDMDMYVRFSSDDIWERTVGNVAKLFNNQTVSRGYDYTYFTDIPLDSMKRIQAQQAILAKDFDSKEAVLQHLQNYKNESRNRLINYIMFFIAVLTLVLLIFPEWSAPIATWLTNIWAWINSLV